MAPSLGATFTVTGRSGGSLPCTGQSHLEDSVSVLPAGTVTFLFTDIEGSTNLLNTLGEDARPLFEEHDRIVGDAIAEHDGVVVRTEGDSFFAGFASARNGVDAAVTAQRRLNEHPWPEGGQIRVRMGLHTGSVIVRDDDYHGVEVHRAARIAAAAHGGQIILSGATAGLIAGDPRAPALRDLGEHRFKDLLQAERIHQVVADGLETDFPAIRSLDAVRNNLPTQLTSFIPRPEVGEAVDLLRRNRLVTLTGPGGTGKTRLSLQAAADVSTEFDAVYFVPLAPVTDPDLVASTIASTLGLTHASGSPEEMIAAYLQTGTTLFVLDNFEQLLDAAPVVAWLLERAPGLKGLATSRAPLRIAGEQEYPVPPLTVPNGATTVDELRQAPAVALFVERAAAILPDFDLTEDNAPAVAEITRRLDGLPLAIELAASRVKLLPPPALAERLGDSLQVLTSARRDLPERQRTLRGAISWSYDLLDPDEQRLFRALSVFRGGASLDAIERVCSHVVGDAGLDLLTTLETLVDHSLVRRSDDLTARFSMLETIREFAWEQLRDSDDATMVRDAHLAVYLAIAEEAAAHLTDAEQARWLDSLYRERDNLRAAMALALTTGHAEEACRFASALWRYWHMKGLIPEGRDQTAKALSLAGVEPDLRLRALEAAGGLAYWAADMAEAERLYDEALRVAREIGEPTAIANALYNAAFPLIMGGDEARRDTAADLLAEAEALFHEADDRAGAARIGWARSVAGMMFGEYQVTMDEAQAALPVFEEAGDVFMAAWSRHMSAVALNMLDRPHEAAPHIRAALDVFEPVGDVSGVILQLGNVNQMSLRRGDYETAAILSGAIVAQQHATGMNLTEVAADAQLDIEPAYESLGKERADSLFDRGTTMSLDEAVALARTALESPAHE
jgi:predicted ATPase/class 3 adenylate cyclase